MTDANTHYLNEQLSKEEDSELRDEAVKDYADMLMSEGGEYYPFDLFNFSEAFDELDDSQLQVVMSYVRDSKAANFQSDWRNEMVARMLDRYVSDYMRKYAMKKAEKEVE